MRKLFAFLFFALFLAPAPLGARSFSRGRIVVHPGGRYLQYADGRPFFYLGDTAWELCHRTTVSYTHLQMADPANNEMIWLGGYDAKRWETARLANQEVIDWGKANGFELIDTGDPIKDYGTAVGTPSNREVLLAYKQQREADDNGIYKNYTFMPTHTGHDLGQYRGTGYGQLCQYRKADGTDQTWAGVDDWRPAGEYRDKAEELEPRAQASLYFYGVNPKNNTGNSRWDLYQNCLLYTSGR